MKSLRRQIAHSSPIGSRQRIRFGARKSRQGGAAVEAAMIIPVVIIMMMGTLEICSGIYLKETLAIAAFEGCRVGVRRRATNQMVRDRIEEVLDERGITYEPADIEVEPDDLTEMMALEQIRVTIRVDTENNSNFIFSHLTNRQVRKAVTMVREFDPEVTN
ncbi:MAG: TadE family protein [Planctomycetota bacterium]